MSKPTNRHQTLKRVKVYKLRDNWVDNGTGYCFGEIHENQTPYLIVKNELNQSNELLRAKIEGTTQFQRQQDTLIVWTNENGENIALSFQEKEGCSSLCDFIIRVHRSNIAPLISLVSVISSQVDGDITELITGPINYPPIEPIETDLSTILSVLGENPNSSYQKQSISKFVQEHNYILKLVKLFNESEEKKKIKNLHLLCNIFKTLILFNEGSIIEMILDDEHLMGVVGILEYDSDFPQFKANHREFLKDESKFKEVLPIKNENIKRLIKKTYKLQFLKDVVLARMLDDPTYNLISTLIHFNQVEIIEFLEKSNFIDEIFALYNPEISTEMSKLRDGVKLVHQFILIAKNLQPHQKTSFYKSLIKKGLFKTIDYVLKDELSSIRVLAAEVIVTMIEHDVLLINGIVRDENNENNNNDDNDKQNIEQHKTNEKNDINGISENGDSNGNVKIDDQGQKSDSNGQEENDYDEFFDEAHEPKILVLSDDMSLLMVLTKFLLEDSDPGLRIESYEAFKSILESIIVSSSNSINEGSFSEQVNTDDYFNAFYSKVAPILFEPLISLKECSEAAEITSVRRDDLLIHLCELVSFCSKGKSNSRSFFLENHVLIGITKLIKPIHKLQLRLAAVRTLKSIISLNDDYYTRYIITNDLLQEVFNLLKETEGLSSLTYSTILDLLEIVLLGIDKEGDMKNFKLLAGHIVNNYRNELETIDTVHSGDDLIKFVEASEAEKSNIESNENVNNDFDDEDFTKTEITTETLDEDELDTILQTQGLKKISPLKEKRIREDDQDSISELTLKRKLSLKDKFTNAGKKIASKFSSK